VRRHLATPAAVLVLGSLAACGSGPSNDPASSAASTPTQLTVYAASSLTTTFTELGRRFEAAHDGVDVRFAFGGSSDLVAQIEQGAPADVLASADTASMGEAVAAGAVQGDPVPFASNTLEIAVPPDNPAGVRSLRDLTDPSTAVVLCAPQVPCGAAAQKVEAAAGVRFAPASEEQAVTDVLAKVESGEADAGLVYVTDVRAARGKVEGITFPEASRAVNTCPIAVLADSRQARLAAAFVRLVTGAEGRAVLSDAGFGRP
jgi:molybdate transport system substrate-binding protein